MAPDEATGRWVAIAERAWRIETIWRAAASCPVEDVGVDSFGELDEDCWFSGDGQVATVRAVADHVRRINDADLAKPVILSADGHVLDGMHRIAKAYLEGREAVRAQRLSVDPEPDWLRSS